MSLKPGQAVDVPYHLMADASIADMPLLDRMAGARPGDIEAFIAKAGPNWGVEFREKFGKGLWQVYKPHESRTNHV